MSAFRLGDRVVSGAEPVLVIAEIGVNHDGSVERALQLVDLAAESGADAIKLQIFRARTLMHPSCRLAAYQEANGVRVDPIEMLLRYELTESDLTQIAERARSRGLLPLATPFSPPDVAVIERLDLPAIKIASPDLVNRVLLRSASAARRPLLISTGASSLEEIERTAGWMAEAKTQFALLHCVSSYPARNEDANLCWIGELERRFNAPVGYSDHSAETTAGAFAVAAGASVVERHLTYDRAASGPDHAASSDPAQFRDYVKLIRRVESMRGRPGRRVLDAEQDVRSVSRQSLVLSRDVRGGVPLCAGDLTVQRPGTGISAAMVDSIVGRSLRNDAAAGTLLQEAMLAAR